MKNDSSIPLRPQEDFLRGLYSDGAAYHHDDLLEEATGISSEHRFYRDLKDRIIETFPVFDPRFLGKKYPSYTFVETENNLEQGSEAALGNFNSEADAQLLGTVLGDVDLIHRRVDGDRWANADFAKWAKERLSFFEQFETYPIFQIARWYGQDIDEPLQANSEDESTPNNDKTLRELTSKEEAVIEALYDEPGLIKLTSKEESQDFDIPNCLSHLDEPEIEDIIQALKDNEILLGSSIKYKTQEAPWKFAFMGLSLGPENGDADEPETEAVVDHDHVIEQLQYPDFDEGEDGDDDDAELWDHFTMPFITSGVGQGWADILLELRVEELNELDEIAQEIRDIEYVESTKTYMMTDLLIDSHTKHI